MSNHSIGGWELDSLGRQIGPYKGEVLNLESRVEWSEQFVSQHDRDIKQIRYEAAQVAQNLEMRIKEHAQLIKKQALLIKFLADVLCASIGVVAGGLIAGYLQADIYWKAGAGVFVFILTVLAGNLLFGRLAVSHLNDPLRIETSNESGGKEAKRRQRRAGYGGAPGL
jgi:hypothetical protein